MASLNATIGFSNGLKTAFPPALYIARTPIYHSQTMTAEEFRQLALGLPETEERSHMAHPDFRLGGKIFATLGYPNERSGAAMLTPAQQQEFLRVSPAFRPAAGKWGEAGATVISLETAEAADVHNALSTAWQNQRDKRRSGKKT